MEPFDESFARLGELIADIGTCGDTLQTEQDVRLKVIDPVFNRVLGWPLHAISTEDPAGDGFIDYKLTVDGFARLIVEAKRDSRSFELAGRAPGRAFKLNGPTFVAQAAHQGIGQAIYYCGQKNAELACVTNGREWIVFRGSRLGDGRDTRDGMAVVFPSLDAVRSHFRLFYDLLGHGQVRRFHYRAHFQEVEGRAIRPSTFRRALYDPNARQHLPRHELSSDLDAVMTSFFQRLSGDRDPDLLAKCFVVTKESEHADTHLARISEELLERIRDLETGSAAQLTQLVDRVRTTGHREFVLLVGTKGAGKSTFIDRFFRHTLPAQIRKECVVVRVNLGDSQGDEGRLTAWLDRRLLEELEATLFGQAGASYEQLEGIFFDEYTRLRNGPWRYDYDHDKDRFKARFGDHIEAWREGRTSDYIRYLIRYVVQGRREIPCLVFDNADQFTIAFQERVVQYARAIYEQTVCLVVLPITDRTSWQLAHEGTLRSFEYEALYLPTPSPRQVLERRIQYLQERLDEEQRLPSQYFIGRGITLSIDNLAAFIGVLQRVFLAEEGSARWVGELANYNIRDCLELARSVIASPYLEVPDLLIAYVLGSVRPVPLDHIRRAIVRGSYRRYVAEAHRFAHNIFTLDDDRPTSPLLGVRILQLLRDVRHNDAHDPFIRVDQVVEYFQAMQVEASVTQAWLQRLLSVGLCLSYDPTMTAITEVERVELAPSADLHRYWATGDEEYVAAMHEVTPIADEDTYRALEARSGPGGGGAGMQKVVLRGFVEYLLAQDAQFCRIPDHAAYRSQPEVASSLRQRFLGGRPAAHAPAGGKTTPPRGRMPRRRTARSHPKREVR